MGYATGVGQDPLSEKLLNEWASLGLNLACTQKIAGKLPGLYLIETDDSGERRFHFWRDNSAARFYFNADVTPLENSAQDIDCFYFSGISLAILDATARARLFQLLHAQKVAGKHVVFDNNYRPKLWPDRITTQQVFNQAFEVATIALITADDHQAVYNLPDLDAAITHAKQRPVKEIVIKRGAAPSLVNDSETCDWLEIATQKVEKVVDTTAAGDSFAAGYLSRRLLGQSPAESAAFGNKVASRVVQHRGAIIPAEAMNDLMLS